MEYRMENISGTVAETDVDDVTDFVAKAFSKENRTKALVRMVSTGPPRPTHRQSTSFWTSSASTGSQGTVTASTEASPSDTRRLDECLGKFSDKDHGEAQLRGQKKASWLWYQQRYLEGQRSRAWENVIVPVVRGLDASSSKNDTHSKFLFYRVLAQVAAYVEDRKEPTLLSMVQDLQDTKGYLKSDCEQNSAVQLIFQMTGWITTFWDPSLNTSTTHLHLRTTRKPARRRIALHCPAVQQHQLVIDESRTPLYRLLNRFGTLLPEPRLVLREASRGGLEAGQETISVTHLAFHHLKEDLGISLEWTRTLNQHLELDPQHNVLYIYRFPSICLLMYRDEEREGTLFGQIYREYSRENFEAEAAPRVRDRLQNTSIESYYVEVLLSYDLIFGRDRRSRGLAKKLLSRRQDDDEEGFDDPLLEILCTKRNTSSQIRALHELLEAQDREDYIPVEKYPFLGERLINLQRLGMSRNTHSWRRLWNDRRDIGKWFIIWSVMLFGVTTVVLGALQLAFQALQTWPT